MLCPRCQRGDLPYSSHSCPCGWKDRKAANVFNPDSAQAKCNRADCYLPALHAGGPCEHHYTEKQDAEAKAKCAELGLETPEQMRAYFRKQAKRTYRGFGFDEPTLDTREIARQVQHGIVTVSREPGQDEQENSS